jgi:hypothetical protein
MKRASSSADSVVVCDRPIYRLELRPEPGCINPVYALRQLLKRALRDHGLRCISVEEVR